MIRSVGKPCQLVGSINRPVRVPAPSHPPTGVSVRERLSTWSGRQVDESSSFVSCSYPLHAASIVSEKRAAQIDASNRMQAPELLCYNII